MFMDQSNFRSRVFAKAVRLVLGRNRRFTPHGLRHTFASLHLSRGTNLLWVQHQGGWKSPSVLLNTYAHFLPTEIGGFADVLTAPDGTIRHQASMTGSHGHRANGKTPRGTRSSVVGPGGLEPPTDGLKVQSRPQFLRSSRAFRLASPGLSGSKGDKRGTRPCRSTRTLNRRYTSNRTRESNPRSTTLSPRNP